jgi:hypothetical protein
LNWSAGPLIASYFLWRLEITMLKLIMILPGITAHCIVLSAVLQGQPCPSIGSNCRAATAAQILLLLPSLQFHGNEGHHRDPNHCYWSKLCSTLSLTFLIRFTSAEGQKE